MHDGKRWRMPVDDFALVRGATDPVTSKQTAERVWQPKFLAEIVAGGDPRRRSPRVCIWLTEGEFQDSFRTAWESLLLVANGHDTKRAKPGSRVDRAKLNQVDLHWHDLRHEGACRLLADGVDIRIIQLMLGHSDIKTTHRYLNITDEEPRKALTGVCERQRQLMAVSQ
jgi:integrase